MPPLVLALALILSLAIALSMRPWRMLRAEGLLTPMLAQLVVWPWLWALPRLHPMPLNLQLSGAVLAVLSLGWPLSIPLLLTVALLAQWLAPQSPHAGLVQAFYLGVLPASLALGLGALMRRCLPAHPFIYILGRGFAGAVLCLFASRVAMTLLETPTAQLGTGLSLVAQWLMAWGDGILTGLLTAIAVAFRPQWLATWSDHLYLQPPAPGDN